MVHFVLVHGAGGAAYFWFKLANLLQECAYEVSAVDLAASGMNSKNHVDVKSFEDYNQPLTDYLKSLDHKVVLVGHSWGGGNVAAATELYPEKVAFAVYIAARMVVGNTGLSSVHYLRLQDESFDYVYGNGPDEPPTGIMFKLGVARIITYQLTSSEDFFLVTLLQRPVPLSALATESITETEQNYGSVPRVYIKTLQDHVFPPESQEAMISSHPFPNFKEVLTVDSDHVAPLSFPSEVHKLLLKIVDTYLAPVSRM